MVVAPSKVLVKVSSSAVLNRAELPVEAVELISVKLLLASLVNVPEPVDSDRVIFPTKSTEDENPPVIATGTFGVVAAQEVKDATAGVLGVLLVLELLELSLPPQATRAIGNNADKMNFMLNTLS